MIRVLGSELEVKDLTRNFQQNIPDFAIRIPNWKLRTKFLRTLMVVGTGIDIVNIERIEGLMARRGQAFLLRIFTEREIIRCQKRKRTPECFAARFAAKEAFLKAIGWGFRHGVRWTDIEIENDSKGRPSFSFHGKAEAVYKALHIQKALLTLSHDRAYAIAHVILEG